MTDGSCPDSRTMSFGVVIATATGRTMIEAMGSISGPTSPQQAECMGCLAAATISNTPSPHLYGEAYRATYSKVYASATLVPNWDVLE